MRKNREKSAVFAWEMSHGRHNEAASIQQLRNLGRDLTKVDQQNLEARLQEYARALDASYLSLTAKK